MTTFDDIISGFTKVVVMDLSLIFSHLIHLLFPFFHYSSFKKKKKKKERERKRGNKEKRSERKEDEVIKTGLPWQRERREEGRRE